MRLRATVLGCGSSGGVPRVGGDWGVCDPEDPRNRRTRCSILVRAGEGTDTTNILVDTSPDLREQLLRADVRRVDALLYTHDHADQCNGIDDMRALSYRMRRQVPTYMDAPTREQLMLRFGYCFEMPEGRVHPPILDAMPTLQVGDTLTIEGPGGAVRIKALGLSHGPTPSLGYLFEDRLAYTPDVHDIGESALAALDGVGTWICDALRYHDHPTHAYADKTLMWQAHTRAKRMVLTNLHIDMNYATLSTELPGAQLPAFDGLEVEA